MEEISRATDNRIQMTRRGYALVTRRRGPDDLIGELYKGYGAEAERTIRILDKASSAYRPPTTSGWPSNPTGVDVLRSQDLIRTTFPTYADEVATVLHIRRAGSISAQQLGQYMLERVREAGGRLIRGKVIGIEKGQSFVLSVRDGDTGFAVGATRVVNAAGPFITDIARMLGEELPVSCVFQQEREILREDPTTVRLTEPMPGGIHCRPDGAESGCWIKLGWAYNDRPSDPHLADPIDPQLPDIVLRDASRLHPKLATYIGRLPRGTHHYGGYYTMTEENWPLIGPMQTSGAFVAGALSGFGSMAACATGEICAAWVTGNESPTYARWLSAARYADPALMAQLTGEKKGHL